ncbi:MAG: plasmid pRiA4b ORF-3 family protein [Propionivibrio sp.]|jgi:hypothetical protein
MGDVVRLKKRQAAPAWLQLKIELAWIKPVIWRRIIVPETMTLGKLHDAIQAAMGWCDCHLHEFEIAGERYGIPDPDFDWGVPVRSERRVRLVTALSGSKTFRYTYDFGDGWEHRIKVEKVLPPDPALATPLCLAGANACPPEDVGGSPGYLDFVDAVSDPNHPEHDEMLDWCGGSFDPTAFDAQPVNAFLRYIKL